MYFKTVILKIIHTLCLHALRHRWLSNIICYYCYFILRVRGLFEFQSPYLIVLFSAPNLFYIFSMFFEEISAELLTLTASWTSFWFSLGILLISWDQLGAKIVSLCDTDPLHPFSIAFTRFLKQKACIKRYYSGRVDS